MEAFLHKRTLTIFWFVLFMHCIFQHFHLPYVAVTKPMLVPLLLLYLMLHDPTIGKPAGKFIFYIGLFLAFFGDVLLIIINDTFFLSGMIAFMLMNLFYSVSFLYLQGLHFRKIVPVLVSIVLLSLIGYYLYRFLAEEMGDYRMPVMLYMVTVSIMITLAVNIATSDQYRKVALNYLIPGALVFLVENILVALNRFHLDSNRDVYVAVMITYGTAQYLMVKGILKAYPVPEQYRPSEY